MESAPRSLMRDGKEQHATSGSVYPIYLRIL